MLFSTATRSRVAYAGVRLDQSLSQPYSRTKQDIKLDGQEYLVMLQNDVLAMIDSK